MRYKHIAVYILAKLRNGTLYVGVTSNLLKRIYEHKTGAVSGFTKQHDVKQLVYYELHETMESAIHREKRIKKYTRARKLKLIENKNPKWNDLYSEIVGDVAPV